MNITRDRHLTDEEAERYRRVHEEELAKKTATLREFQSTINEYRDLRAFISALKHSREAKGLTRQQVGQLASIEPTIIEAIEEQRELNPLIKVLTQYANALGLHLTLVLSTP